MVNNMRNQYDVFICYSRKDFDESGISGNVIFKIQNLLDQNKISYWIDKEGVLSGESFLPLIAEAIGSSTVFLFVSSRYSNASKWITGEIFEAFELGKMIIPFRIDDSPYSKDFRLLIRPLDFIDYLSGEEQAMQALLKAIQNEIGHAQANKLSSKSQSPQTPFATANEEDLQMKSNIIYKNKVASLMEELAELRKEILEWEESVGLHHKICPICGKKEHLGSQFCPMCGWQYPWFFLNFAYEEPNNEQLKVARKYWKLLQPSLMKRVPIKFSIKAPCINEEDVLKRLIANMIYVDGGTFIMGATPEQGGAALEYERPVHQVKLYGYYINKYPVTQMEWWAVMGSNPSKVKGWNHPVESVSWNDCMAFIQKLNQKTNKSFRLPTEAEWEFAARGGTKSKIFRYCGSHDVDIVGWHKGNSGGRTAAVGGKLPNELGLYDMSGNVCEWCMDFYGKYYARPCTNPMGPAKGRMRVFRGGCWNDLADSCRISSRFAAFSNQKGPGLGLRIVLSPEE